MIHVAQEGGVVKMAPVHLEGNSHSQDSYDAGKVISPVGATS